MDGNPLRTIPAKFRSPWPVIRDYIKSVAAKSEKWNEMKILLVGQEGVGKTTLLKTLRSKKHRVSCKENLSTGLFYISIFYLFYLFIYCLFYYFVILFVDFCEF